MKWLRAITIVALAAEAAHGQTVTVFQSGFEPGEGYTLGSLNGQNGWSAFLGEDPNFGRISGANPLSGSQSVLLRGSDVQLGSFGNYAAVVRDVAIAPVLNGSPLHSIEITGRAAIVDPTPQPNHLSFGDVGLYSFDDGVTDVRVASDGDQLLFGYGPSDAVPVASGVPFEFRHVLNFQTGLITGWMNGQVVYEDLPPFSTLIPDSLAFELSSRLDNLPFDTQVWFDDLHVTATYVPSPGASLLAVVVGVACVRRRRHGGLS